MRPTREDINMEMAWVVSKRSTCQRAQVGCVITVDNRIVTTGYNGAAKGEEHCTDESCSTKMHCPNSIHAEANAIAYAAKKGVGLEGGTAYITHSPCLTCSRLLIQAGIKDIYYSKQYSGTDFDLLIRAGIKIHKHL